MEKKAKFIAIGNQKGGVGKSALTAIYASYLHYELLKNVIVVDCDYPQHSIFTMRESDIEAVENSVELQAMLEKRFDLHGRKAYKIIKSKPETALEDVIGYMDNSQVKTDVVLFDIPGTVNSQGIVNLIFNIDYIFIPIIADKRTLKSSLSFALSLKGYIRNADTELNLKNLFFFWNRVDKRENTELYELFTGVAEETDIKILEVQIPDAKRYNKELSASRTEIFRSTLFPPDKRLLKNSRLEEFVSEVNNIIGL